MSTVEPSLTKIVKRDGRVVDFDIKKIEEAIFSAAQSVGGNDRDMAGKLAEKALFLMQQQQKNGFLTVEQIQDAVEKTLIEEGHAKTAKAFILYRHKKEEERQQRALIINSRDEENMLFSNQALKILERRYLLKDKTGSTIETPRQMLQRVAKHMAEADLIYGATPEQVERSEQQFFEIMAKLYFLPNSPTLMNAGTEIPQLSSCIVLPIHDTMESIFGTLRDAAVIHQRGSGTGFSFSQLRPKGEPVKDNLGVASGPVAFMNVYDSALDVVKQGGVRPGANMAVLRVDHPDIIRFIEAKREKKALKNFNLSVAVTDRFMKAVLEDREYYLTNPRTESYVGRLRARDVFAIITQNAWKKGDPGLLFIDEINRKHPAKHLGEIETTNQCGEAPLLPYEMCMLGGINVARFVDDEKQDIEWEKLKEVVQIAVHFLDNAIDVNKYPNSRIERQTKRTRKFGLGIMGFADMLCKLRIKYDSEKGLETAEKLISFIRQVAYDKSSELAEQRGYCEAWEDSEYQKAGRKMRNMTCISISPTGTRSILADCSSGCEPLFSISYQKAVLGDSEIVHLNKDFETIARKRGFYSSELIRKIARSGSIQQFKEIPKDVRDVFVTAQNIDPEWHIRMQATLQKYVDNAISKTINFPRTAAIRDVEEAYILAWKARCKGITIYRDGSYEDQVMVIGE